MAIKALLFDKDGTLFDYQATWNVWAGRFIERHSAGDRSRAVAMAEALDYDLAAETFLPDSRMIAGTNLEAAMALAPFWPDLSLTEIIRFIDSEAMSAPLAEVAPLAPLLDTFRARGLALGVATNDGEAVARGHLEAVGVLDRFAFVAGFDSGHGGKPAPGMLLAFADHLVLAPAEIVMVGDSTHDLLAAHSAGMMAVGVLTGMAPSDTLAPHAHAVLPSIVDLPAWLEREGH